MTDYPVQLKLAGRLCVVVGGGPVGLRKIRGLLAAGARVRLVCTQLTAPEALAPEVELVARPFRSQDLEGAFLAMAATGDAGTDQAVAAEARRRGILVSVPGDPSAGDFTLPAVVRQGNISLTVATGGRCPALAPLLSARLAEWLKPGWPEVLEITAAIRRKALAFPENFSYNQNLIARLLESDLAELTARGDAPGIDRLLRRVLGEGFSLAELNIKLPDKH
jgi:precorrin-2 dehydrogenase/sirohydrochlorin ferrochelatase